MRASLIAVLAAAIATGSQAGTAAPTPAVVAGGLKAAASICTDAGGTPVTKDAIKRADLNGDGHDDFVLDVGSIQCDGAFS